MTKLICSFRYYQNRSKTWALPAIHTADVSVFPQLCKIEVQLINHEKIIMNSIRIRMDRKGDLLILKHPWRPGTHNIHLRGFIFTWNKRQSGHEYISFSEFLTYYIELPLCVFPRHNRRTDGRTSVIGFWFNCSRETFRRRYIQTELPSSNVISKQLVLHSHHKTSRLLFQYVSLLRPPVTESSAPGADLIDKLEWKQVRILRTQADSCLNYMRVMTYLLTYLLHGAESFLRS
jgi:hypothetical protein